MPLGEDVATQRRSWLKMASLAGWTAMGGSGFPFWTFHTNTRPSAPKPASRRELLEGTDLSIDEIARRSGFGAAATLRHHFRRRLNLSPIEYRERFSRSERV